MRMDPDVRWRQGSGYPSIHSSRKMPLLPVIRFGDGPGRAGMLRYGASKIEEFITEQERLTNIRRKNSGRKMVQPTCSPTENEE